MTESSRPVRRPLNIVEKEVLPCILKTVIRHSIIPMPTEKKKPCSSWAGSWSFAGPRSNSSPHRLGMRVQNVL